MTASFRPRPVQAVEELAGIAIVMGKFIGEPAKVAVVQLQDAVAELIEADSDYQVLLASMRSHPAGHTQKALERAEKRCTAALARVKGGAA